MALNIPLLKNNIIENIIVADYSDICPEGYIFGPQLDGIFSIGWIFDGEKYIDPNPPEPIIVINSSNSSGQIA